ncbi:CDP-alcohol phosphatidyltransferase family protein [Lutibaculum baratangense]|uniref:Phosphatidylcholine synthase n=1 Tax=Lutibaculum baratangense AMV1 TaxID=631454 RepID=V4RU17_9HYPH|nr:phosphatidylcholine synthase [Lutibaculum baratangense]ESR26590.1 Phosphatidylcholine synthase [Lutibaculum baratangense AMV1]
MSEVNIKTQRSAGLAVHALTASGVFWALLALLAAGQGDFASMFAWLGVALVVDGIDGPLARRFDVGVHLPNWDGVVLDLVVDYLTYVFIPAYAAFVAGLFPYGFGLLGAGIMCLSSAFFFGYRNQKTADNYFLGFPTIWNVVVFYAFVFQWSPWVTLALTVIFAVLTFTKVTFLHPVRVVFLRPLTLAGCAAWLAAACVAVWQDLEPDAWVLWVLGAVGLYMLGISALRTVRGR